MYLIYLVVVASQGGKGPFIQGKKSSPSPLYNILVRFIWFSSQPMEIFSSVMAHFGASKFKMNEVRQSMHGTDALMWSCFAIFLHIILLSRTIETFFIVQALKDKLQTMRPDLGQTMSELFFMWVHFVHFYAVCQDVGLYQCHYVWTL